MPTFSKRLAPNEIGTTGSHQAGIVVPKTEEAQSCFPRLPKAKNPSTQMRFLDPDGKAWDFTYTYYNGKLYGQTRNEYRLTGMTKFFKAHEAKAGDFLVFELDGKKKLVKILGAAPIAQPVEASLSSSIGNDLFEPIKANTLSLWTPQAAPTIVKTAADALIRRQAARNSRYVALVPQGIDWSEPPSEALALATSCPPSPENLLAVLRTMGYTVLTAMADIVDNAISAGATTIDVRFNYDEPSTSWSISIADNGHGMDAAKIVEALTLAHRPAGSARTSTDLGRFSVGLKTAALHLGRRLTVRSRKNGSLSTATLDLDRISSPELGGWLVHHRAHPSSETILRELMPDCDGTTVLIENLDASLPTGVSMDEAVEIVESVGKHLSMVFHRFMEREASPVALLLNKTELAPIDPALSDNPFSIHNPAKHASFNDSKVVIRGSCVAHPDYLSPAEKNLTDNGPAQAPGIYLYRNDRIVCQGGWLGMEPPASTKTPFGSHVRIAVDIGNTTDGAWALDVMKASAIVPHALRDEIKKQALRAFSSAKEAFARRRPAAEPSETKSGISSSWRTLRGADGLRHFIDRKHPLVLAALASSRDPQAIEDLIRSVETQIPVERVAGPTL